MLFQGNHHVHLKIRLRNLMHSGKPTHKEANGMGKKELNEFKGRVMKAKGYAVDNVNPDDSQIRGRKRARSPVEARIQWTPNLRTSGKSGWSNRRKHGERNGADGTRTIEKEINEQPCC